MGKDKRAGINFECVLKFVDLSFVCIVFYREKILNQRCFSTRARTYAQIQETQSDG